MMHVTPLAAGAEILSVSMPQTTVVMVADEADDGAEEDPQKETLPEPSPMEPIAATTGRFHGQLAFRLQTIALLREDAVLLVLRQFHGPPLM